MIEVAWQSVAWCDGGRGWSVVAKWGVREWEWEKWVCWEEWTQDKIGEGDARDTILFEEILHFLTTVPPRTVFISLLKQFLTAILFKIVFISFKTIFNNGSPKTVVKKHNIITKLPLFFMTIFYEPFLYGSWFWYFVLVLGSFLIYWKSKKQLMVCRSFI